MSVPLSVQAALAGSVYRRTDDAAVDAAIADLGVEVPKTFLDFYRVYEGPFSSDSTGMILLDVACDEPNIVSQTEACREHYGFEPDFIVLSELLGGSVLVLKATSGEVFEVDFEGGEVELKSGRLEPTWKSFADFLEDYFT